MMGNVSLLLPSTFELDGLIGVALADYRNGESLNLESRMGGGLEIAVAGDSELIRTKLHWIYQLGLTGALEEILISLSNEYHLIRLVKKYEGLFLYLVLDRSQASLALARLKLLEIEDKLVFDMPAMAIRH